MVNSAIQETMTKSALIKLIAKQNDVAEKVAGGVWGALPANFK